MCFKDRTFCASPGCTNACGRQMSAELKIEARNSGMLVSYGLFCEEEIDLKEVSEYIPPQSGEGF